MAVMPDMDVIATLARTMTMPTQQAGGKSPHANRLARFFPARLARFLRWGPCPPKGVARLRPEGAPYTREIPKQKGHPTMWDSLITVGTSTPGPPLGHRLTPLARSGSGGESPHTCSNVWQEQNLGWMKAGRAAQWWFLTPDPFPPRPLALCFHRKERNSGPLPHYRVPIL